MAERLYDVHQAVQTTDRLQVIPRKTLGQHHDLADLKIESVLITAQSHVLGLSPIDLDVRQRTQALIVAVRRNGILMEQPDPHIPFAIGDLVYLVGSKASIHRAVELLIDTPINNQIA